MENLQSQSDYVIYASRCGAKLDSDVIRGGGTDDTAALQAALDRAPQLGRLKLVMDGAALIRGLKVHSNTTIECLTPACGFFLAAQSNCAVLRNANKDMAVIRDRNITLLGGTYNQNCPQQAHHIQVKESRLEVPEGIGEAWVIAFEFYGVENVLLRDVTIRNQRTFALLMANWRRVCMENIYIDLPDRMHAENQDGLHFWGPGQFLTLRNIQGRSGDDFIALSPDEHDYKSSITDVLIDGVHFDDADQGIRILSRKFGRLDRTIIRNVTGTYRSFGVVMSPFFDEGIGNVGNIVFDTIDLRCREPNYDWTTPHYFRLHGNAESVTLRNIYHHLPFDNRPVLEVGWPPYDGSGTPELTHIGSLLVDGLHIYESETHTTDASYIKIMGQVDHMAVRNVDIVRPKAAPGKGSLIETVEGADIGTLLLNGVSASRMHSLLSHRAGGIGTLQTANIFASEMAGPVIEQAGGNIGTTQPE